MKWKNTPWTWQIKSVKEKLEASKVSRIDTVKTQLTSDCVEGCSGQWLQCTKEVLLLNGIDIFQFATSIKDLLIHGRSKNRKLIITGPATCAKTSMLKPLKLIFNLYLYLSIYLSIYVSIYIYIYNIYIIYIHNIYNIYIYIRYIYILYTNLESTQP